MWIDFLFALLTATLLTPLVAAAVRWRAPGRANSPRRSFAAFFPAVLLLSWGGIATLTHAGPDTWGALWLLIGGAATFVGILLSDLASPKEPTAREARRVRRRGELLDPVYFLYIAAVGLGLLAAGVTRFAFTDLA